MISEDRGTIDVYGLAAVINARLAADARLARAICFLWLCGGTAIALVLSGLGIGLALLGYSYVLSVQPATERTASVLANALKDVRLKAIVTGTMSLAQNSSLKLAPRQSVQLSEDSTIRLDPNSTIRVVGDLKYDVPQPSKQQLQVAANVGGEELPFTSYTIFKSTKYGIGDVVTGWSYALSDPIRPKHQYCYYRQTVAKGATYKHTIATNGFPKRPSPLTKLSFDFDGAVANCIWFSGA